jgi:competence protein ComEA
MVNERARLSVKDQNLDIQWNLKQGVSMKIKKTLVVLVAIFFTSISFAIPVNINNASADQLATALSGVGSTKAQAIVEYRTVNGDFSQATQITNVSGIGSAIYEKNKADILIK